MEHIDTSIQPQETVVHGKQPWLGAFLNFFGFSFVGYFYARCFLKGIVIVLLETLFSFAFLALMLVEKTPFVPFVFGACIIFLAFKLYISIDIFKIIEKQNSVNFENKRKQQKDPWRAVFFSFLWPGLGHAYLRRWIWFIVISAFNLVIIIVIELVSNLILNNVLSFIVYEVIYCGLFATHCYWLCTKQFSFSYNARHILYAIGYRGLYQSIDVLSLLLFMINIGQIYRIPSNPSMAPTAVAGDSVFVNKVAYWNDLPQIGDVIVFQKESNPPLLKRVVAVGGQTVTVNNEGVLFVDGKEFSFEGVKYHIEKRDLHTLIDRKFLRDGAYQVPLEYYFVIGDNYSCSYDSRDCGPIEKNEIIGKAIHFIPGFLSWWNSD